MTIDSPQEILDGCHNHYARAFGFGYDNYEYTLKIFENGSAEIRRRATLRAYEAVGEIDVYLTVQIARRESEVLGEVNARVLQRASNEPTIITTSKHSDSVRERTVRLDITPPLRPDDVLEFETIELIEPGTVALLFSQLEQPETSPFNTFSLEISWPTRKLSLAVLLPYPYRSQAKPLVWRGHSRISVGRVAEEIKGQLRSKLETVDGQDFFRLELNVDYPQQGLLYALRWTPPVKPLAQEPTFQQSRSIGVEFTGSPDMRSSESLTWLHLSDLHYRGSEDYNVSVVKHALLSDIKYMVDNKGLRPDFVVFTGDLAFSGQPDQYEWVEAFLDQLLVTAGIVSRDRLFVVPGNHDIDRTAIDPIIASGTLSTLNSRDKVSEFLDPKRERTHVFTKFRHYQDFFNRFFGNITQFNERDYFWVRRFLVKQRSVGILGLNSAWMSSFRKNAQEEYSDDGILLVGERQIDEAMRRLDSEGNSDIVLAILHHPFSSLNPAFDASAARRLLHRSCDFILRGHLHESGLSQEDTLEGQTIIIPAGACYDRRDRPTSGYNFVRLDFDNNKGHIYLRRYSERSREWQPDLDATGKQSVGEAEFNLPTQSRR